MFQRLAWLAAGAAISMVFGCNKDTENASKSTDNALVASTGTVQKTPAAPTTLADLSTLRGSKGAPTSTTNTSAGTRAVPTAFQNQPGPTVLPSSQPK